MSSKSVYNELPPDTVLLLVRHLCRILGSITLKKLTEYFPSVDMKMNLFFLETLLKSQHLVKTSVSGTYLFVDLGKDIETKDLQAEHDALSVAKERVLVRRGIIQPTSSNGGLDRSLKTEAGMTSNNCTVGGELKVESSLGIGRPTFKEKVAARLTSNAVEFISNQSSHPGKPRSASSGRAIHTVGGAVPLYEIPARRSGLAHSMNSNSMKTNSSPRAGAQFFDFDSAFNHVLEGHSSPPQITSETRSAAVTADTPSFVGSVTSAAQPADSSDQGFSEADPRISTIPSMSRLISDLAGLQLSITSDTIRQVSDLPKSYSTEAEATLKEEFIEADAISQEGLMKSERIPGKKSESVTNGSDPGLARLNPSAQEFTPESSPSEDKRITSPLENQPESNLPQNQSKSSENRSESNLPRNSSQSSIPAGPSTTPVAPPRQRSPAPVIPSASAFTAKLNAPQPPKRYQASNSAVYAPQYQWTKKKTGDEVDNAFEALETFCRYNGLKPPTYSTTFMPMEGVFFCIVFVGGASFKSYPTMARSEKRAKEVAAEQAVKELGITSSMLAALLSMWSGRPKTLS